MRPGPRKNELVKKILNKLDKHPEGLWVRRLSRDLGEPVATVYKYVIRDDYCGKFVVVNKTPKELGGNMIIKLKDDIKWKEK